MNLIADEVTNGEVCVQLHSRSHEGKAAGNLHFKIRIPGLQRAEPTPLRACPPHRPRPHRAGWGRRLSPPPHDALLEIAFRKPLRNSGIRIFFASAAFANSSSDACLDNGVKHQCWVLGIELCTGFSGSVDNVRKLAEGNANVLISPVRISNAGSQASCGDFCLQVCCIAREDGHTACSMQLPVACKQRLQHPVPRKSRLRL